MLTSHYQPIVDLDGNAVVGYEALAREDGAFPAARFAAARESGTLAEFDTSCQRVALTGATDLEATLFVNVEPECFDGPPPGVDAPERVIIEVTERSLTTRPAELLLAVERVRARGWGVAVDDVGVDWRSLALLPFLRPDVIKLDRGIVSDPNSPESVDVVRNVRAHIDRDGGLLLTEGVETPEHERCARVLGSALAQGWHYGRPAPLPASPLAVTRELVAKHLPIGTATPFELLRDAPATARKADILALSIDLERKAMSMRDPAVVLATFQRADRFGAGTRARYAELARGAAFVAAFGEGLADEPAPGVRGARLSSGEALQAEWTVIVVGPHEAMALIARDLGDSGDDDDRRFEYALTEDRELVMQAARSLMLRVAAEPAPRPAFLADLATPPPAALRLPAPRPGVPASRAS